MSQVNLTKTQLGKDLLSYERQQKTSKGNGNADFYQMVQKGLDKLNNQMAEADKLAASLAAGKEMDIPEVMLAISKADISFRMFVQMRNKALSAYEEIMRLQF